MLEFVEYGDEVLPVYDKKTYSVALREGGYANITNLIFVSITTKPEHKDVYDKYGYPFDEEVRSHGGLLGEPYFVERKNDGS